MAHARWTVLVVAGCLGGAALLPSPARGQKSPDDKTQDEAFQKTQKLLDERLVETEPFQTDMPLDKFLQEVEKQLPQNRKVSLGIDKEAFGAGLAELAATPVRLPPSPPRISLRKVLEVIAAKTKGTTDYRLGNFEVTITTPQRALVTVSYDIRDLLAKPGAWASGGAAFSRADVIAKDRELLQTFLAAVDAEGRERAMVPGESTQILNCTHLVMRTSAARHAQVAQMLQVFRRLADVAVFAKAQLYEVDVAFYKKLKSTKRPSLEELEQQFLQGGPNEAELFKLLEKQELILTGEERNADHGQDDVALLSRHRALRCLASPEQVAKGDKGHQVVLEGVSFLAAIRVSPDRRSVRVKLTEKATEIEELRRVKAWDGKGREVDAESAVLQETVHARVLEIPDNGSILVLVHHRPVSALAKDRWWVLHVSVRIYIEEEARLEVLGIMRQVLPPWLLPD
jgi:hypothetical protein